MGAAASISEAAWAARDAAAEVVDRHSNPNQKQASIALYGVLARCLELCERAGRDPVELAELKRLFAEQPKTGNRRYVEKGSDIYVLVCRFVFTTTDRTNAMRYASAIRQAGLMQIRSSDLFDWMRTKGGVNALYYRRPLAERDMKIKVLRLNSQIEFSRDKPLRLELRWRDDNTFTVVDARIGAALT